MQPVPLQAQCSHALCLATHSTYTPCWLFSTLGISPTVQTAHWADTKVKAKSRQMSRVKMLVACPCQLGQYMESVKSSLWLHCVMQFSYKNSIMSQKHKTHVCPFWHTGSHLYLHTMKKTNVCAWKTYSWPVRLWPQLRKSYLAWSWLQRSLEFYKTRLKGCESRLWRI